MISSCSDFVFLIFQLYVYKKILVINFLNTSTLELRLQNLLGFLRSVDFEVDFDLDSVAHKYIALKHIYASSYALASSKKTLEGENETRNRCLGNVRTGDLKSDPYRHQV